MPSRREASSTIVAASAGPRRMASHSSAALLPAAIPDLASCSTMTAALAWFLVSMFTDVEEDQAATPGVAAPELHGAGGEYLTVARGPRNDEVLARASRHRRRFAP